MSCALQGKQHHLITECRDVVMYVPKNVLVRRMLRLAADLCIDPAWHRSILRCTVTYAYCLRKEDDLRL